MRTNKFKILTRFLILSVFAFGLTACSGGDENAGDTNNLPTANTGVDQTVENIVGDVIVLDGSGSSDPDGDSLTYQWSLVSAPGGSTAELSDTSLINPSFIADVAGTYALQLVVNDGQGDSLPDGVLAVVKIPVPAVTIVSPENLSIVYSKLVTITGTVSDPDATITVDENATANTGGNYSSDVTLLEGSNTVTVIATNSTGEGSANVEVTVQTGPGPAMSITSHKNGFLASLNWNGLGNAPSDIPVTVIGTTSADNGIPTVTVNDTTATVKSKSINPICKIAPKLAICLGYSFSSSITLAKGNETITAVGTDSVGQTTLAVNGVADSCHIQKEDAGVAAVFGTNQSNRCHEVDGCSVYLYEGGLLAKLDLRNDPMPLAVFNQAPTAFGSGKAPPEEFFIHGKGPAQALPCNYHDVCYQTYGTTTQTSCDTAMYGRMKAVCRKAYPSTCPYSGLASINCPAYFSERGNCFAKAATYYTGLKAAGGPTFTERQKQYSVVE